MADEPESPLKSRAEAERAEAHRRYNEAFDLVDRARQKSPEWPEAPPRYDEEKLHILNTKWDILPDGSVKRPDGLKGPIFDAVWPVLEPILRQQREFNSDLVNHLNRNIEAHRQANDALAQIVPGLREGFNGLCLFEHLTVHFLQTITPFVDTRQREVREAVDELRNVAEVAQRAAAMARREIERLGSGAPASASLVRARQNRSEPSLHRPPMPSSTSASKIASAAPRTRSARASPTTCRTSPARPTCSMSAAAAASFSIC